MRGGQLLIALACWVLVLGLLWVAWRERRAVTSERAPLDAALFTPRPAPTTDAAQELAVIIPFFNAARFHRPTMNVLHTREMLRAQGIRTVVVVEAVFPWQQPSLATDVVHVPQSSVYFQKEALFNYALRRLPPHITKVVCLDSDLVFENPDWWRETAAALDTHDAVQPFGTAQWLWLDFRRVLQVRPAFFARRRLFPDEPVATTRKHAHAGFALAARRDLLERTGGLFPYAVTGGGDVINACLLLNTPFADMPLRSACPDLAALYEQHRARLHGRPCRTAALRGAVMHLYHGSSRDRQYHSRHAFIRSRGFRVPHDMRVDDDGLLVHNDPPRWNATFLEYFRNRDDDGVSWEE
jgi:hypothetical protein